MNRIATELQSSVSSGNEEQTAGDDSDKCIATRSKCLTSINKDATRNKCLTSNKSLIRIVITSHINKHQTCYCI